MISSRRSRLALQVGIGVLIAVLAAEAVYLFVHAVEHAPVNNDAGYFLATVERHAEGWTPYRDLRCGYTPLGLHVLLGARLVVGETTAFGHYLAVGYLFLAIASALTYALARRLHAGRLESGGAAILLLLLAYASEGMWVTLEPYVAVFVLLALHACLSARTRPAWFLIAGVCVGLAFLSKQYGLAALPPVGLYALATGKGLGDRLRRGALVAAGFVLSIALLLGAYRVLLGVSPVEVLAGLGGPGYGWWGLGAAVPVLTALAWPGLVTLVWLPFTAWARRRDPGFWLVLLTAVFMLAPLMVRAYAHYLLLSIPFLCVLSALVVAWGREQPRRAALVGLTAVVALVLTGRAVHRDLRQHRKRWDRASQERVAAALNEHVPRGSPGLVLGNPEQWLFHLADLDPVLPRRSGYAFPGNFDDGRTALLIYSAPVIIGRTEAIDAHPRARRLMRAHGFVQVGLVGEDVEIHRRPR